MCGRYTLTATDLGAVVEMLDAILDPAAAALHRPRYNIAPTDAAILARAGTEEPRRPRLVPAVWGLRRGPRLIINIRSEGAATRFREAYQHGRAVVPADGFYEWTGPPRDRRPTWFHAADGSPLLMAAVFDDGDAAPAFALLTAAARPPIAAIHDRMPVLLSREGARLWLFGGGQAAPDDVPLGSRPVSPRVNATAHDDPACLEPAGPEGGDPRAAGTQLRLF